MPCQCLAKPEIDACDKNRTVTRKLLLEQETTFDVSTLPSTLATKGKKLEPDFFVQLSYALGRTYQRNAVMPLVLNHKPSSAAKEKLKNNGSRIAVPLGNPPSYMPSAVKPKKAVCVTGTSAASKPLSEQGATPSNSKSLPKLAQDGEILNSSFVAQFKSTLTGADQQNAVPLSTSKHRLSLAAVERLRRNRSNDKKPRKNLFQIHNGVVKLEKAVCSDHTPVTSQPLGEKETDSHESNSAPTICKKGKVLRADLTAQLGGTDQTSAVSPSVSSSCSSSSAAEIPKYNNCSDAAPQGNLLLTIPSGHETQKAVHANAQEYSSSNSNSAPRLANKGNTLELDFLARLNSTLGSTHEQKVVLIPTSINHPSSAAEHPKDNRSSGAAPRANLFPQIKGGVKMKRAEFIKGRAVTSKPLWEQEIKFDIYNLPSTPAINRITMNSNSSAQLSSTLGETDQPNGALPSTSNQPPSSTVVEQLKNSESNFTIPRGNLRKAVRSKGTSARSKPLWERGAKSHDVKSLPTFAKKNKISNSNWSAQLNSSLDRTELPSASYIGPSSAAAERLKNKKSNYAVPQRNQLPQIHRGVRVKKAEYTTSRSVTFQHLWEHRATSPEANSCSALANKGQILNSNCAARLDNKFGRNYQKNPVMSSAFKDSSSIAAVHKLKNKKSGELVPQDSLLSQNPGGFELKTAACINVGTVTRQPFHWPETKSSNSDLSSTLTRRRQALLPQLPGGVKAYAQHIGKVE